MSNYDPYPKGYFTPPDGAPLRETRAIFSELGNVVIYGTDELEMSLKVKELIKELLYDERYGLAKDRVIDKVSSDYQITCRYWEEYWRYEQSWDVIERLLKEVLADAT